MNILITAPSLNVEKNVSGISSVVNTLINYNLDNNYFHFLLGKRDKHIGILANSFFLLKKFFTFPYYIKKQKINLVHQNLPFNPKGLLREYIINAWCRILRVPVVLHIHGGIFLMNKTTNPIYLKISRSLFKYSKKVIVLSEIERISLAENYGYFGAELLCNSVDHTLYKPKTDNLNPQKPIFLFLGRIHESKGVEDIIQAFRLLKKKHNFKFILCGTGPLQNTFVEECEKLLGIDFEFHGVVSGKLKLDIISKADFFLLPSRYGEGLPMALLETMSAGLVPIVTDDASMKYVVKHKSNGLIVKKMNPQDLYENISAITTSPLLYRKMSSRAIETIYNNYNIVEYIVEINKIYLSAMNKF